MNQPKIWHRTIYEKVSIVHKIVKCNRLFLVVAATLKWFFIYVRESGFPDQEGRCIKIVRPFVYEAIEISLLGLIEKDRILAESEFRVASPFFSN